MDYTPQAPVINGLRGSFKQAGGSWGRNDSGYFWNYIYEGTAAEVEAEADICDQNKLRFEVTDLRGGRKRLTFQVSTAQGSGEVEQPEEIWELEPAEAQKDFLEADFPFGNLATLSSDDKLLVAKAVSENVTRDDIDNGYFDEADDTYNCISWYLLMKAGQRYFPIEASVIRHTQIVSNIYTVKASFTNVGRIISSASMTSSENVPAVLLFDVPETPTPNQYIETAGDLKYGWRKHRPRVSRLNYSKWQISQTWELGLWPVRVFGEPI